MERESAYRDAIAARAYAPAPERIRFGPAPLLPRMARNARDIYRYRHLVHYLVSAALRTENVNSSFGFLWWLLDPLLLAATYTLLIDVILDRGTADYPVYLLTALLSWEFFSRTVRNGMAQTLIKERTMRQVAFPKSVIPIAATLAESVHFVFALIVLVVFALPFGILPSPVALLALPIAGVQLVFTLAVAFFFSALNMFFRDTDHLSGYLFRVWFYLSPGLYLPSLIPDHYRPLYDLNPFVTLFSSYRDVVISHSLPNFASLGILAAASVVILILGYGYFVNAAPKFAKVE
jgi:ABC-type polysaccharide/polyol phosphate export permease